MLRHRIPNNGLTFDTKMPPMRGLEALLLWRLYESAEIRFLRAYLKGCMDVIELGSSVGVTGSHILTQLPPKGRLICVEANPDLIPTLRQNLEKHASGAYLEIVHAAVACGESSTALFAIDRDPTASKLAVEGNCPSHVRRVPRVSLNEVVQRFDFRHYGLLCDIEGAEASVIWEDGAALQGCSRLVIELHSSNWYGRPVSVEDMLRKLIGDHGFHVLDQHGPVFALGKEPL